MKNYLNVFSFLFAIALATVLVSCEKDETPIIASAPDQTQSIAEIASADSRFSTLVSALERTGLSSTLSTGENFTVFAPTNSAFEEISEVVATLNTDQLAKVLTYHVVGSANVRSTDLSDNQEVSTVNGENFTVALGSSVMIKDANGAEAEVVLTDVQATNGIIHVLNKVILPKDI